MAALYPIFREINAETEEIEAEEEKYEREETAKRLTPEQCRNLDRRAVAEWLHNAGNFGTPAIKNIVGELLTEIEGDTDALNTPAHIENVLREYDKLIADNPNNEKAMKASDVLFNLASDPKATDEKISSQMVNVADGWLNPEGGKFSDDDDDEKNVQIGDLGIDLYNVLHNPQIPVKLRNDLMVCLNDMFNDLPPGKQGNLELTEQYLVDLVAYHIEQNEAEKTKTEEKDVLDLSEVCTEFLGTNEATAGKKPVDLATLN